MPNDASDALASALAEIDRAFKAALAAIEAEDDPNQAFRLATELTEALRVRTNSAADQRVQTAARIYASESMSLANLADRIGVSKARAAQLIRTAKETQKADDPHSP